MAAEPPADAKLFDADGVPVSYVEGSGEAVAWTPEPRPFPFDSFLRNAAEINRDEWDDLRPSWEESDFSNRPRN